MVFSSGPEGIAELKKLGGRLPQILSEIDTIRQYVSNTYLDNAAYLGEHSDKIGEILQRMAELNHQTKQSLEGVAAEVLALASEYENLAGISRYNSDL